jgi:hypothetical protein
MDTITSYITRIQPIYIEYIYVHTYENIHILIQYIVHFIEIIYLNIGISL